MAVVNTHKTLSEHDKWRVIAFQLPLLPTSFDSESSEVKIYHLLLSSMFCDAVTRLLWLLKLTVQTWTGNSEICLSLSSSIFLVVFVCSRFFKAMQWVDSSNVHGRTEGRLCCNLQALINGSLLDCSSSFPGLPSWLQVQGDDKPDL